MRKVFWQMMAALDGFMEGSNRKLDWHRTEFSHGLIRSWQKWFCLVCLILAACQKDRITPEAFGDAAAKGDLAFLRRAVEAGFDVNARPKQPNWFEVGGYLPTALSRAVSEGQLDAVRFLLDHGVDVNLQGNVTSPLLAAVRSGHSEAAILLLEKGADPNAAIVGLAAGTAVHEAAASGKVAILAALLAHNADPNTINGSPDSQTPLHSAARAGQEEAVRLLLDKGADPERRDRNGRLPLHEAMLASRIEITKLLASRQREPDPFACALTGDAATLRRLLRKDPSLAKQSPPPLPDLPLLHVAASAGHVDVVALLLEAGADPSAQIPPRSDSVYRGTPLSLAVYGGHVPVVKALLTAGADVEAYFPLSIAVVNPNTEIMRLLLDHGADVNANKAWGAPLQNAAVKGNIEAIELLLSRGADIDVRSQHGETPLFMAVHFGQLEAVKALLAHGAKVEPPMVADLEKPTRTRQPADAEIRKLLLAH